MPTTSWPNQAKHVAVTVPTYPVPMTATCAMAASLAAVPEDNDARPRELRAGAKAQLAWTQATCMLGWPSGGHLPAMWVTIVPVPSVEPPSASLIVKAVAMGNVVAGNDQTWCSTRVAVPSEFTVVNVTSTFIENASTAAAPEQKPRLDV